MKSIWSSHIWLTKLSHIFSYDRCPRGFEQLRTSHFYAIRFANTSKHVFEPYNSFISLSSSFTKGKYFLLHLVLALLSACGRLNQLLWRFCSHPGCIHSYVSAKSTNLSCGHAAMVNMRIVNQATRGTCLWAISFPWLLSWAKSCIQVCLRVMVIGWYRPLVVFMSQHLHLQDFLCVQQFCFFVSYVIPVVLQNISRRLIVQFSFICLAFDGNSFVFETC